MKSDRLADILGDIDEKYIIETKKPVPISLPNGIKIHSIACGSQHTLILTTNQDVLSFGNNDHGQLGRLDPSDEDRSPQKIDMDPTIKFKGISAGDCYSIVYNDENVYVFGAYIVNNFILIFLSFLEWFRSNRL